MVPSGAPVEVILKIKENSARNSWCPHLYWRRCESFWMPLIFWGLDLRNSYWFTASSLNQWLRLIFYHFYNLDQNQECNVTPSSRISPPLGVKNVKISRFLSDEVLQRAPREVLRGVLQQVDRKWWMFTGFLNSWERNIHPVHVRATTLISSRLHESMWPIDRIPKNRNIESMKDF